MDIYKEYITKERKIELEAELAELTVEGRTRIAKQLESEKELGDLKENAEYHQAREDQAILEERIRVITETLRSAIIITGGHKTEVVVGAEVTIAKKGSPTKTTYVIVGSDEADPANGKISFDSPLVSAMLGKKSEDTFSFKTPGGDVLEYRIVSIK